MIKKLSFLTFILTFLCSQVFSLEIIKEKTTTKLKDGSELVSELYYAENTITAPVLFARTPYGKEQYSSIASRLAEEGYIVMVQDVRGTGESSGTHIPFINEAADGIESVEWISGQKFYNGKIGMWGISYSGFCAAAVAELNSDLLNSIINIEGGTNLHRSLMPGGAFHLMLNLTWLHFSMSSRDSTLKKYKPLDLMNKIPLIDGFKIINSEKEIEMIGRDLQNTNVRMPVVSKAATLHVTGWYDFFNVLTIDQYQRSVNAKNKLIVGPWRHNQMFTDNTKSGDEDFGPGAVMGMNKLVELMKDWFDYSLNNLNNNFTEQKDIKLFVMGKNSWEEFDRVAFEKPKEKTLYLGSKKGANSLNGDGGLDEKIETGLPNDTFTCNPLDPVPTFGGALFHFYKDLNGVRDQSQIEQRTDVLVYSTPLLEEKMKIAGKVKVDLFVSSGGKNADFTAKLVEVKPDGYAKIITEGIFRMVHPGGKELIPGKIYQIEIDLGYTAIEIPKGNIVRLEISGSNFPKYNRNPNTTIDPLYATEFIPAKQTVYLGSNYPSKIAIGVAN